MITGVCLSQYKGGVPRGTSTNSMGFFCLLMEKLGSQSILDIKIKIVIAVTFEDRKQWRKVQHIHTLLQVYKSIQCF